MSCGASRTGWRALSLVIAALIGVLSGAGAARGGSAGPGGQPLGVARASLTQNGQQLVWKLQLIPSSSADASGRGAGRTLCLLLERRSDATVTGQLCADRAAGRRSPDLVYSEVAGGIPRRGRVIVASIRWPSGGSLMARFLPGQVNRAYRDLRWQVRTTLSAARCTDPPAGGGPCTSLYPARPALLKLHTPRLVGCAPAGPSLVYSGTSARHEVALTFDDGPWPQPPSIDFVSLLARYHVPGTFFEIGDQIGPYDSTGAVERRMLTDGDMIGDHTWSHPKMTALSASAQRSELERAASAIRRATGFTPCLWRPPYGAVNRPLVKLARSLGFLTIQWDVDPTDWKLPGSGTIYQRVVGSAHNGAIILQHFGGGPRYQTYAALPREIRTLRSRGYRFVTVAQMLGLRLIYR